MLRGSGSRLNAARSFAAALSLALLFPTIGAAALLGPKQQGPLTPLLRELARPSLAAKAPAAQAAALGLPAEGPGSLVREGRSLLVELRFDAGAVSSLDALRSAGAEIAAASRRYQLVTARVPAASLRDLAAVGAVEAVTPVRAPLLRAGECEGGSAISEGVFQLRAETARQAFGVDGGGVTVGVLSDSFDQATEASGGGPLAADADDDVASKDLPGLTNTCLGQQLPVDEIDEYEPGPVPGEGPFDEGRAMLQIVHDMASGSSLAFASAFNGELAFAQSIEDLARPGVFGASADVIVDDVGYFEEPFFQDGPIAAAIGEVTADGVAYLAAAGNENLLDSAGNEIASWEAPAFRDSGDCPPSVRALAGYNATHCMDFNPDAPVDRAFGIRVDPGATLTIDLQWAEPWSGVETDVDAFLLDFNGALLAESAADNLATQKPVEILQWENPSGASQVVQLTVNRFGGGDPRLKFILLGNGGGVTETEYPRSGGGDVVGPAVYGHVASPDAIAVGAVPYSNASVVEEYSSRGPATHYFAPFQGGVPAPALPSPEVISKPDVAATDCGRTTFFAFQSGGVWRFCGTSAAAPHAAGVAALMIDAAPAASPEDVREALVGTGAPVGGFGPCAVGGGLVDAVAAIAAATGAIEPVPPPRCTPPSASGPVIVQPGSAGFEEPPPPRPVSAAAPPSVVPAVAPSTGLRKRPPKRVRTRRRSVRLLFAFAADQPDATFQCKIDRSAYRACPPRLRRRFGRGRHVLRVRARSAAGLLDPTPAVYRFRVEASG
jgi:Subtilase family